MCDLYHKGDVNIPIIANYPGGVLRVYKKVFNNLPWPLWQLLVLKNRRIIYNPIAKCASSSLKAMILDMSDLSPAVKSLPLDTHATGLQLGDLPINEATDILDASSYLKFAVVRDPFDRLVSAYLEKFVVNRMSLGNQFHTRAVISRVFGIQRPTPDDFSKSITFSQFVNYVINQSPDQLDPHWCPQYLYLKNAIFKLFRFDHLDELYDCIGICPETQRVNTKYNVTRLDAQQVKNAYELTPEQMLHSDIATTCFYDESIRRKVKSYFALDFTLVESLARAPFRARSNVH